MSAALAQDDGIALSQPAADEDLRTDASALAQGARHSAFGDSLQVTTRRTRTIVRKDHLADLETPACQLAQRHTIRDQIPPMLACPSTGTYSASQTALPAATMR